MSKRRGLKRREFLSLSAATAGAAILSACSQPAPAAPTKPAEAPPATATTAPAKPTEAPKPTAPAPAAAKPTVAAKPAATAKPAEPKLGATLIGKLEGPEVITDPAQYPKQFKEAPQLAELAKQGKLPPVEKRLPEEPLVIKPVHSIGKYGGNWRRGFTGPADGQNGHRVAGGDRLLHWHPTKYPQMVPNVAKGWKYSDDYKTLTVYLRKGLKWSDGNPFTADDIMFWYEDFYQNKDLNPTPSPYMSINGKPGTIVKVDDYTVEYRFPEPYPMFVELLGSSIPAFGGPAVQGGTVNAGGGFGPKHYLKQFHPKYVDKAELDKKVAEAKFDNWTKLYLNRASWHLNPELPVLTPWRTTTPANTPVWTLERNPYYWAVDTDGNQLPYIDKITMTLAENLEVLNLRSVAGEYDMQERHNDIAKVPVFLENQQKGNYKLSVDPAQNGTEAAFRFNLSFNKDPEIAKWISNRDFRRALSLGIDRDQINETIFLGIGTPGSTVPSDDNPYNPGPEYRKLWSVYDLKQANEMLDKIGLDKKDADGFRLRTDGKGRLQIEVATVGAAFIQFTQLAEMVKEQWKKIGVWASVVEMERSLWVSRYQANEAHITVWQNDGSDETYLYPGNFLPFGDIGTSLGGEYAKWFASGGKQGIEPKDPAILKGWELFTKGPGQPQEERYRIGKELWKIVADEVWAIGTVGQSGAFMGIRVTKNNMSNVPARQLNIQAGQTPNISRPSTFYYK